MPHQTLSTPHIRRRVATNAGEMEGMKKSKYEKLTSEEFNKRFENQPVTPVGVFDGVSDPLRFSCDKCGNQWITKPRNIMYLEKIVGCPTCAQKARIGAIKNTGGRKRLEPSEFIEKLADNNPSIMLIGKYSGTNVHAKFRCKACNYSWDTVSSNVLYGKHGCPACNRGRAYRKKLKITGDMFSNQIDTRAVSMIGGFVNWQERTTFACNECSETFRDAPKNIRYGRGCSRCKLWKLELLKVEDGVATVRAEADGKLGVEFKVDELDYYYLNSLQADFFGEWGVNKLQDVSPVFWNYGEDKYRTVSFKLTGWWTQEVVFIDGDHLNLTRANMRHKEQEGE